MNCTLQKIKGKIYVCTNRGCGRMIKIEGAKPSDAIFATLPCAGEPVDEIAPELLARAEQLGALKVDKGNGVLVGPGYELKKLLAEMDGNLKGCNCAAIAAKMNQLGPAGCREKIEELLPEIVKSAKKGGMQVPEGFDPLPVVRALVLEAIRRAEVAAGASDGHGGGNK